MTKLLERLALIGNLRRAAAVLDWDMQTYMPPGAAAARGEQLAALSQVSHAMFTSEETARLLESAEQEHSGSYHSDDVARMLDNTRYDFDRYAKIPADLAAEISRHSALAQEVWQRARAADDFASLEPLLEKTFDLQRQVAGLMGYQSDPYDALLDGYERGATANDMDAMFSELKPHLVELTQAIGESPRVADALPIHGSFSKDQQNRLTMRIVERLGYDFAHGRQDQAPHPFCTSFSRWDVRITTRFDEAELGPAFYASLHEAGHALYEMGMPADHDNDPLGDAASMGFHESQSRLWENLVGRSLAFAEFAVPMIRDAFPDQLADLTPDRFFRASNRVSPSLIRVEADEVTYNLHVLLRFELERALLNEDLAVRDLPEAWNAKMNEYLGVTPPNNRLGVMQDVHWPAGLVGYFPTYSLGNVMSGQLWHAVRQEIPDLDDQIRRGEFASLLKWLRNAVHEQGRRFLPGELLRRATGEPLTARYYLDYLKNKYAKIYEL